MTGTVEGPCDCTGPHFHTVVHECCSKLAEAAEQRRRAEAAEAKLAEVEKLARRKGWWTDLAPSDLFARQAEIREGAIGEIAEALGRCPCGKPAEHVTADPDSDEWACLAPRPAHQRGVVDCPCESCVDRFLDGQQ